MKSIKKVGVVGAGTMGSALAQKFAQEEFKVLLADREMKFVEKGLNSIKTMLKDGLEKKVFTEVEVNRALANLQGTENLADLKDCDLIIEAIFEDFKAKEELFNKLGEIVPFDTILATNTSSFSVTELATTIKNPERFLGLHYFYHAAKNRLVEIIPGEKTSKEVMDTAYQFAVISGKDPIYTKDKYGFAINRFFVPWLNEAVKILQEGIATIEIIDSVYMKTLGIGMGPFALMNATGVPISLHSQRTLEFFGPSYKVAQLLQEQVDKKENWVLGEGNIIAVDPQLEKKIAERMLGGVFFVCSQILESKICSSIDLNKGAKIGLKWKKGPVDLMKQIGEEEVMRLVKNYASIYDEKVPFIFGSYWKMEFVKLEKFIDRAIITMNRPEDSNAFNEEMMKMLEEKFMLADGDPNIKTIFITGTGKAFVAGADIKFFVKNMKNNAVDKILEFTRYGQEVFNAIDQSKKTVVALLNGMTLGGGLEFALCADIILAVPKTTLSFPETGIGIYPGLGGTQRPIPRIGKGLAKYLILTGKTLTAKDAEEIGLIDGVISFEDMFEILNGEKSIPWINKTELPAKWKKYSDLYSKNHYEEIINGNYLNGFIEKEEVAKLAKTMSFKAPIAMHIAEDLVDQARGPLSELEKLTAVFSTHDAMLGLTSIGKKVQYKGE